MSISKLSSKNYLNQIINVLESLEEPTTSYDIFSNIKSRRRTSPRLHSTAPHNLVLLVRQALLKGVQKGVLNEHKGKYKISCGRIDSSPLVSKNKSRTSTRQSVASRKTDRSRTNCQEDKPTKGRPRGSRQRSCASKKSTKKNNRKREESIETSSSEEDGPVRQEEEEEVCIHGIPHSKSSSRNPSKTLCMKESMTSFREFLNNDSSAPRRKSQSRDKSKSRVKSRRNSQHSTNNKCGSSKCLCGGSCQDEDEIMECEHDH